MVVIAHNEQQRAPDAVRAILGQDSGNPLDVVFVDDGSTDGTAAVVTDLAAADARIRLLRLPENRGRGAARAAGLAAATGDLVAFVDADVIIPPDWLRRCLIALGTNAAVGGIAVPDGHTAVLARITGARPRERPGSMPITGANVLFQGSVIRDFGFDPSDRLGEDFRLAARLLAAGHRLVRVPGLVARHAESKTYREELEWRLANGVDAVGHVRLVGPRFADAVWCFWLIGWLVGLAGVATGRPGFLLVGLTGSMAVGFVHAASRFHLSPLLPAVLACIVDIPLMNAYMIGRTVGLPRLIDSRKGAR
jgi:glycosyltransferase involved in cell wall biosynthesis